MRLKTTAKISDRSAIMRAVKSRDTKPEKTVRNLAWSVRRGYRLHRNDLPGKPDLAYGKARKAIYVHGCFWHGHDCARGARVPKSNRDYWLSKIARNVARDRQSLQKISEAGWDSFVVWECELRLPENVRERLSEFLT